MNDWLRWDWIVDHVDLFVELLGNHIYLAIMPILFGLLISVPLGVACVRWPRIYPPVLGTTTILYSVPSIALFVLLIDFTGTEPVTVIIPLTVYTLAVLVRNVVDGLRSVDESVRQSAIAMGFTGLRRLLRVDLPIATPVIMAGLRVATVSNISMISISALIGIPSLGNLFIDGFQRDFKTPIVAGMVLTIALAVAADGILVVAQRLLTPWARTKRSRA
jgi:osmoprotectant transport system permease protein